MTLKIKSNLAMLIGAFLMLMKLTMVSVAQSATIIPTVVKVDRSMVFKRAQSLNNGVNISWLEQTWNKSILNDSTISVNDFILIQRLGFKSVRLPIAYNFFLKTGTPEKYIFSKIDWVVTQCKKNNLKLVIDYHYGDLNNDNYLTETPKITDFWKKTAHHYLKESPSFLFFEIYNEPVMNDQLWKDAAFNIVSAIRVVDKDRTLLVGASNYNSIYELSRFVRLADENVIYSFHFYEPFFFTHQGADWVGLQMATTGVPFPYSAVSFPPLDVRAKNTWGETNYYQYRQDGNEQSLIDKLSQYPKKWSLSYDVPVICTEYGAYNKYADLDSRCRYIKAMHKTLKALNIPGMMWDYNGNFSIFNGKPSMANLPACMKEAINDPN